MVIHRSLKPTGASRRLAPRITTQAPSNRQGQRRWRSGDTETVRTVTLANSTLSVRKVTIKAFYRWLRQTDEYPPEVRWLKNTRARDDDAMPVESVLTRDELVRMIDEQHHAQHKAVIATLYDSGCRASEFTSQRVRAVTFDEHGAVITLPKGAKGLKTGARRIRVLQCTPYLRDWVNAHPRRNDPERKSQLGGRAHRHQPVFTHRSRRETGKNRQKGLAPSVPTQPCDRVLQRGMAGSRDAHYFGWARGSDMPSHYVHLSGKDYEENMLRGAGKIEGGRPHQVALLPRMCQCGHENMATADYCQKKGCGKPLTVQAAEKREKASQEAILGALAQDPVALERLTEAVLKRAVQLAKRQ